MNVVVNKPTAVLTSIVLLDHPAFVVVDVDVVWLENPQPR